MARSWDDPEADEYLASLIPNAEFVRLPGFDSMPWVGDSEAVIAEIQRFLNARRMPLASDTVLATLMFTDVVRSTETAARLGDRKWRELLSEHDMLARALVGRYRGNEQDHAGDGFLFTFDGPARAIRCACAVSDALTQLGIEIRVALHTGECESVDGKLRGIALHAGARVLEIAKPGEVFVSSTVRDLVAGSGFSFKDAGHRTLRGVPGRWRIFSLERSQRDSD